MNLDNEEYKILRKETERKLKAYPYYLMAIEMPDLRYSIVYEGITYDTEKFISKDKDSEINIKYMKSIIKAIDYVLDRLDECSKRIIETAYFRDDVEKEDVQKELMIDRNRYYRLKKNAIEKFMIVLR